MDIEEGKITFNFKIEIRSLGQPEIPKAQSSMYTPPKTTNPSFVEISFDGTDYLVPKTTGGLF